MTPSYQTRLVALCIFLSVAGMLAAGLHAALAPEQPDIHTAASADPASGQTALPEPVISEARAEELTELMQRLQANPNDGEALLTIGNTFLEAGDWTRAEVFLSRALMSRPADARARLGLGISLYRQEKASEAAKVLEELLAIEEDPTALYNLAVIYKYRLQREEAAQELLKRLIALPGASEELKNLARQEL